jgi:hypothetical protein
MADSHWNLKVGVGKDSRKSGLETPILIRETWLNIYTTFTHKILLFCLFVWKPYEVGKKTFSEEL